MPRAARGGPLLLSFGLVLEVEAQGVELARAGVFDVAFQQVSEVAIRQTSSPMNRSAIALSEAPDDFVLTQHGR